MVTRLPLFPLGTVLVPGEVLPLHIFEPRYRQLVDDLIQAGQRDERMTFGVIAIRAGLEVGRDRLHALHGIGCVAEVLEVRRHAEGSSEVESVGRERFRLIDLDADAGTPYLTGLVEFIDEPVVAVAPELVARVQAGFDTYTRRLTAVVNASTMRGEQPGEAPDDTAGDEPDEQSRLLRDDPTVLSYLVTATMLLHLGERQKLLASPDAGSRLRAALQLLRREITLLEVLPSVPAIDLAQLPADPR